MLPSMSEQTTSQAIVVAETQPGTAPALAIPQQAESDAKLVALWLHDRSPRTQRAYRADVAAFFATVRLPLRQVTLGDVQGYKDSLAPLATASQARKLSAVKSLLSFGHALGYLAYNVGTPVKLPAVKQTLAEPAILNGPGPS